VWSLLTSLSSFLLLFEVHITLGFKSEVSAFIDNFSTGQHGAASVEHFLERNDIVLFFYRLSSILPYQRHIKNIFDGIPIIVELTSGRQCSPQQGSTNSIF
jgi:hypothetical protein